MSVFEIDHYHPLSAYHVDEEKQQSVMNTVFKKMLFKPIVLDGIFEPFELKKTFEIWFELELMSILAKITKTICSENHISIKEPNVVLKDISGPFSTILGVDTYNYGWNIYGLLLSEKKYTPSLEKEQYCFMIRFLLSYFKTYHHFRSFYLHSDEDIYKMVKSESIREPLKKLYKVETFTFTEYEVEEIYKWCKLYNNSVLYIIQKIYEGRVPTWENEKILKEIKRYVHRKLFLPNGNDLRCNNNLLYLYYNDKLKLPINYSKKIEIVENTRKTTGELQAMKQYSPCFLLEDVYEVGKDHECHLEYPRKIKLDGFVFPNILECIYYKLLCIYHPKKVAYKKSSSFDMLTWDQSLKECFKKHFHHMTMKKLEEIQYRLCLLDTDEKEIVNKDKLDVISGMGENFLGKMLMEIRSEMKDYFTKDHIKSKEALIYFLNQWLQIWKKSELSETELIHFYFDFYFHSFQCVYEKTDVIFPISLENTDNHDVIQGYFKNFQIPSSFLMEPTLMTVFQKRGKETVLQYMKENWNKFSTFHKDIMKCFCFLKPQEITPFPDQSILSLKQYIVYKHYMKYN